MLIRANLFCGILLLTAARESARNLFVSVKGHFVLCKGQHLHSLKLCALRKEPILEPPPPLQRGSKVCLVLASILGLGPCPGSGCDGVNFHKKL